MARNDILHAALLIKQSPYALGDVCAFGFFFGSWAIYGLFVSHIAQKRPSLNLLMHQHRRVWMEQMGRREARIVDANIIGSLLSSTAFFASTSLIALGGSAELLRASDEVVRLYSELALNTSVNRGLWEIKVLGLAYVYGYAFFKFAWAYRLFSYAAILIGATPLENAPDAAERQIAVQRAAAMVTAAAKHFLIGQRAMFFSFGYLGWFISPLALVATTSVIIFVIYRRQFASDALAALIEAPTRPQDKREDEVKCEDNGRPKP